MNFVEPAFYRINAGLSGALANVVRRSAIWTPANTVKFQAQSFDPLQVELANLAGECCKERADKKGDEEALHWSDSIRRLRAGQGIAPAMQSCLCQAPVRVVRRLAKAPLHFGYCKD